MKFGRDCDLKELLSGALRQAVSDYTDFAASSVPKNTGVKGADDAKNLAARHAAGRSMVGHITALAKLVHWWSVADEDAPADVGEALPGMVAAARSAISGYAVDAD